jgi:hypothetical protein
VEWKDITTYSRNDKERIPEILEAKISDFNIRIHRHIYYPSTWLLSCHQLAIKNIDLRTDTFSIAETLATNYLIATLDKYVSLRDYLMNYGALVPKEGK